MQYAEKGNELKPCPFCGNNPYIVDTEKIYYPKRFYRIICSEHCCMQSKMYDELQQAISEWNKRV